MHWFNRCWGFWSARFGTLLSCHKENTVGGVYVSYEMAKDNIIRDFALLFVADFDCVVVTDFALFFDLKKGLFRLKSLSFKKLTGSNQLIKRRVLLLILDVNKQQFSVIIY